MIVVLYPDKRDADLRPRLAVTMDVLAGSDVRPLPVAPVNDPMRDLASLRGKSGTS
jgi:hypothetical protein